MPSAPVLERRPRQQKKSRKKSALRSRLPLANRGPSKEQLPRWERGQPSNAEQFLAVARPRGGITTLIRVRLEVALWRCRWCAPPKPTDSMGVLSTPRSMTFRNSRATAYWITLSARSRSVGGNVTPRALAVLRFWTSSNFIGCSTGRSAGLAPFRILSIYVAARRYEATRSVP
jgi:hypothetical protein